MCGSRHWTDPDPIDTVIRGAADIASGRGERLFVVHGAARGADTLAGELAREHGGEEIPTPAVWRPGGAYDPSAGPKRNQLMLDENPDLEAVWAFKDAFDFALIRGGTEDMVRRAHFAGIKTYVVSHGVLT